MSISQNFPSTRPSLNLNFARSQKLDPRITFTRSSSATYTGGDGLIKSAATDTPRFDFNATTGDCLGLLIEESRSNLTTYSEDFTNVIWTLFGTASRSANTVTAPDGNTTADTVTLPISSGIYQFTSASASTTYTFSVWIRTPSTSQNVNIVLNTNLGDATELTVTATTTWQRFSVTKTTSVGTTTLTSQLSTGGGNTFYVWGAQTEAGAFPTSYIPTVASTVTRSADNASITGTNFSSFYNSTEGTLFAASRINALGGSNYPGIAYVDDGTNANCIGLTINDAGTDVVGAEAFVSNSNQYYFNSSSAVVANQLIKAITAYKVNDFAGAFNMGSNTVQTDTSGSVPTVNRLIIGDLRGSTAKLNGTISQLSYYPVRLSNSQLQTLTK
jgi:hypothetical protein